MFCVNIRFYVAEISIPKLFDLSWKCIATENFYIHCFVFAYIVIFSSFHIFMTLSQEFLGILITKLLK